MYTPEQATSFCTITPNLPGKTVKERFPANSLVEVVAGPDTSCDTESATIPKTSVIMSPEKRPAAYWNDPVT